MTPPTLMSVSGLSKMFGRVITADEISFDVRQGEALGIVGPNGAGKSTLLNLIGGVVEADAGASPSTVATSPASGRPIGPRQESPDRSRFRVRSPT